MTSAQHFLQMLEILEIELVSFQYYLSDNK